MQVSISKAMILTAIKEYFLMTVGMMLYSFGWICCIFPAKVAGGGAAGLAMLIYYSTHWLDVGMLVLIINIVLIAAASFIVGWKFGVKTIYCVIVLSFGMSLMQTLFTQADGTFLDLFGLNDKLLSSILGGVFAGIGVALCFMQGGSTGGVDIVAMIINKYRSVAYGKIVRFHDGVIITLSGFILGLPAVFYSWGAVIYGLVLTVVFSYVVDTILTGNQQSSQIFIVSKDYREMADAMNGIAHRGATVIDAMGWYSKAENKIVMVVCRKRDLSMILKVVKRVDPDAFITIGSVMGVYGKGFDALNKV